MWISSCYMEEYNERNIIMYVQINSERFTCQFLYTVA